MPAISLSSSPSPAEDPVTYAFNVFESLGAWALDSKGKIAKSNPLYHFHKSARWYPQSIHLMMSPKMIIRAGLDKEHPDDYDKGEIDSFKQLCDMLPGLEDVLVEFHNEPQRLEIFCTWMDKWADDARNEDTSSLKKNAMKYLPLDPFKTPVMPPIPTSGKELRGFNHVMTARLLTPMKDIAEFDNDPNSYIQKHADGQVKLTASRLPFFLYDETNYDPDIPDLGLLKGHFIIRVFRCLMTGPSSAIDKRRRAAKKSKAEIHNLDRPTAKTIAYACVLARQTLSSAECYSTTDGDFNYAMFYDIIEALLDDGDDPWVNDVFEFYIRETPDLQRKIRNAPLERQDWDGAEELIDEILELRRRRAREKEGQEQGSEEDIRDPNRDRIDVWEDDRIKNEENEEQALEQRRNSHGTGQRHYEEDEAIGHLERGDDDEETLGREQDRDSPRERHYDNSEEEALEQRDSYRRRDHHQLHRKRIRAVVSDDDDNNQRSFIPSTPPNYRHHNTRNRGAQARIASANQRRRGRDR
ncbi:hypothetical protein AGABI1DRAFT_129261 [Agaricus bisporus var. burnettii JB137-S8]|uniref:Uncharacterized protein n=1 Tax=Agaricus bisporus var. burnettii (strain JB137-S8 / ATCC MYA-4627 / FGSC 10392) TaxID=597362 RepID=K5XV26_AGABU|nr:uncharacterized protein AGABI1DRAFT_129261 [Agaricus bisporus var. burnettii JB137-S8]EKM78995.1 hypothetical protein AGABI1DRAFT_129261 [Agaricus bisporus var. burnettii JB137-S8]